MEWFSHAKQTIINFCVQTWMMSQSVECSLTSILFQWVRSKQFRNFDFFNGGGGGGGGGQKNVKVKK